MMPPDLIKALSGEFNPKFLATLCTDGTPNLVPVISLSPEGDDRLVFAELMIWKTKKNLLADPRIGVAVLSADLNHWTIRGIFEGFEETGPRMDRVASTDMFRYNAYTGPRSAGVIRVEEATAHGKLATAGALAQFMALRLRRRMSGADDEIMRPRVAEKFGRLKAARCIAFADGDRGPIAVSRFSLMPTSGSRILIGNGPYSPKAGPIAASVITMDPIAYQARGRLETDATAAGSGAMIVEEVYSSSPPLPGKRIA